MVSSVARCPTTWRSFPKDAEIISDLPGISTHQLRCISDAQLQALSPQVYLKITNTDGLKKISFHGRMLGGGPTQSRPVRQHFYFEEIEPTEEETEETLFIQQLSRSPEDKRLLSIAFKMIQLFKDKIPRKSLIAEVCFLARVRHKDLLHHLLEAFSRHICDSALVNIHLFNPLKQIIQTADPACLDQDDLIKMMWIIFDKIIRIHIQHQTAPNRHRAIRTLAGILDAMGDTGVIANTDVNIFRIDKDNFRNSIFDKLKDIEDDPYLPLACEASYAVQALARIPKNESPAYTALRRIVQMEEAVGYIFEACTRLSPGMLIEAYAPLKEAIRFFPDVKKWHAELRSLQLFLQRQAFRDFERFLCQLYQEGVCKEFEIGVLNLLCEAIDQNTSLSFKTQTLSFLENRCCQLDNHALQAAFVQRFLELAGHPDAMVSYVAKNILSNLQQQLPRKQLFNTLFAKLDSVRIAPPVEPYVPSTELYEEARVCMQLQQRRQQGDPAPLVVSVPPPLPGFVGRKNLLAKLEEYADKSRPSAPRVLVVLQGLSGVGKSELATQFAHLFERRFSVICCINAETLKTFLAGLKHLDRTLQLTQMADRDDEKQLSLSSEESSPSHRGRIPPIQPDNSPETICDLVYSRLDNLSREKPWLLIVDNATESFPLPSRGGMVLATSQTNVWPDENIVIEVPCFTYEEALELFRDDLQVSDNDKQSLIRFVDAHPLLLRNAIHNLRQSRLSIGDYLGRVEELHPVFQYNPGARYPRALKDTLLASLDQLKRACPIASDFLRLCAFIVRNNLALQDLDKWIGLKKHPAGTREEIIAAIENFSLGKYDPDSQELSFHSIVKKILESLYTKKREEIFKELILEERQKVERPPDLRQRAKTYLVAAKQWLFPRPVLFAVIMAPLFQAFFPQTSSSNADEHTSPYKQEITLAVFLVAVFAFAWFIDRRTAPQPVQDRRPSQRQSWVAQYNEKTVARIVGNIPLETLPLKEQLELFKKVDRCYRVNRWRSIDL